MTSNVVKIGNKGYVLFSVAKFAEGGWAKKDLANTLKEHGISSTFRGAYSPYVGQFGIYIEAKYEDEVSEFLWGHGGLDNHTEESE